MEIHRIVIHPGIFHADECVAVATALIGTGVKSWDNILLHVIERRNPTQEDFENPNIWVIDCGKQLNPSLGNYDHHQDSSLPASNMLVLNTLTDKGIFTRQEKELLCKYLFEHVSMVDTTGEKADHAGVPTLSRIIRGLNGVENGFDMAMQVAFAAVLSAINAAKQKIAATALWEKVEKYDGYAINDSPNFISGWQELAKEEGINYLITPNREPGKYQILSRDSDNFPVPVHEKQTHNGGWMAVYKSLEDAVEHVKII